jgi:hypothetical protein
MHLATMVLSMFLAVTSTRTDRDPARYERYAKEIEQVVEAATADELPFTGPGAREASALALGVTAVDESGLMDRIERCECRSYECDHGFAMTLYQLHPHLWGGYDKKEICGDNVLATKLAMRALRGTRGRMPVPAMYRTFAAGSAVVQSPVSDRKIQLFYRWIQKKGLSVTSTNQVLVLDQGRILERTSLTESENME